MRSRLDQLAIKPGIFTTQQHPLSFGGHDNTHLMNLVNAVSYRAPKPQEWKCYDDTAFVPPPLTETMSETDTPDNRALRNAIAAETADRESARRFRQRQLDKAKSLHQARIATRRARAAAGESVGPPPKSPNPTEDPPAARGEDAMQYLGTLVEASSTVRSHRAKITLKRSSATSRTSRRRTRDGTRTALPNATSSNQLMEDTGKPDRAGVDVGTLRAIVESLVEESPHRDLDEVNRETDGYPTSFTQFIGQKDLERYLAVNEDAVLADAVHGSETTLGEKQVQMARCYT
ncbi:hypothetical protein NLU13_8690 [Sarocladium strictum]|uniref:Uncharacterized protein n=1 Tax=Sarocladium strictum TaxID=5046 RepID=A0AA39L5H1_SARSR|nr:hypothetical protein NLU13_8690 [Sarocladium strictum]